MSERMTWDEYGLALAEVAAKRSACSRDRVGAVIMGADRRIISTGYNGLPSGFKECSSGGCPRGQASREEVTPGSDYTLGGRGYCPATHAEVNAVLAARGEQLSGATMFTTRVPCSQCWAFLAATSIDRVVWGITEAEYGSPRWEIRRRLLNSLEAL